jgi:hypothetical protein
VIELDPAAFAAFAKAAFTTFAGAAPSS